jgi:hypothetical protein
MPADPDIVAAAAARVAQPDWEAFSAQLEANGGCERPVRLKGSISEVDTDTGEMRKVYSTDGQPQGVLLKACGCRRATRCAACSAIYKGDARVIVSSGLAGGKGAPEEVSASPAVFVTLTAPSFGSVHRVTTGAERCHAAVGACEHGPPKACGDSHGPADEAVGSPICVDCYDYAGQVIWNARSTELWRRTIIAIPRALAACLGIYEKQLGELGRLSFVRVVEFQRRGVVHFHAVVRFDAISHLGVARVDVEALAGAVRVGWLAAAAPNPADPKRQVTWGTQIEVTPIRAELRRAFVNYLAKYTTKSTDEGGALDHRIDSQAALDELALPEHLRRLVDVAWRLGGDPHLAELNLRHWAHTLGFRGHWLTKSRSYSTTFAQLRSERQRWRREQAGSGAPSDGTVDVGQWTYQGTGYSDEAEAWLAVSTAARRRQDRRAAWEER